MGYNSSVAYTIRFRNNAQRDKFVLLIQARGNQHEVAALEECEYKKPNSRITFSDRTKWYASDPSVEAHHTLMGLAVESFPSGAEWRFVRAGEETPDIEESADGDCGYELWEEVDVEVSLKHVVPEADEGEPDD